jgi:hypothetical protein
MLCTSVQPSHGRTASAAEPLQQTPPQEVSHTMPAGSPEGDDGKLQKAGSADMDSFATLKRIAEALGEVDREELSEAGLLDVRSLYVLLCMSTHFRWIYSCLIAATHM